MDHSENSQPVKKIIQRYLKQLERHQIKVWRMYLYGSYARGNYSASSDIDLAVFLDKGEIDSFEEEIGLMRLRWDVDLRIEPHCFARMDYDESNPLIREIIETGERII